MRQEILESIKNGVIISCQAQKGDPTRNKACIIAFAKSALIGGAKGLRLNGAADIKAVKTCVSLPVIGIFKVKKRDLDGSLYYHITPTPTHAQKLIEAGADIVAVDATKRSNEKNLKEIVETIKKHKRLSMADVSTLEEAERAVELGFDIISTTLAGYTPWTRNKVKNKYAPDFELAKEMVKTFKTVPVIAEGRIWEPEHVRKMFKIGVWSVVIGSAVTRPWLIVKRFVEACPSK